MTTLDLSRPVLLVPSTPNVDTILDGIVHLHAHCILHDHTLATFHPPLSHSKMSSYWSTRLAQVGQGARHIIVQLLPITSRTADTPLPIFAADNPTPIPAPAVEIDGEKYEVAGVVSLWKPESETGPHRGEVEKLFTSPNHRRKGVARNVMRELERVARQNGRWSLLLDTIVDSDAEYVYPRLGYDKVGVVKAHGYSPEDGRLVDELFFSKDLRNSQPL